MRFDKIRLSGSLWLHRINDISTYSHGGVVDEGRFLYSRSDKRLYYGSQTEWVKITTAYDILAKNTKMLFGYWPLPTGWNIQSRDDMVVMMTSASGEIGTETGDTWVISSTVSEDGSHDHGGQTGKGNKSHILGQSDRRDAMPDDDHRHNLQVDGLHTHTFDGSWRPAYAKFCEAKYE